MKKFIVILLLMFFLVPFSVSAASISSVSISDINTEQSVGSSFYLPVNVRFSGIDRNSENTTGIYTVVLALAFDDSVLEISGVLTDFYDTQIYKDDNYYYILSIIDLDSTGNKCVDQFLACTDYSANIRFYVKNDSKETVDIKVLEAAAGGFKVDPTLESYLEENAELLEYTTESITTVSILKSETEVTAPPETSVVIESEPNIDVTNEQLERAKENFTSHATPSPTPVTSASSNANLKALTIDHYEIPFKEDQYHYYITVSEDVESLTVHAEPADSKATYEIIGADSIASDSDVRIVVKAENGEEQTYTIRINRVSNDIEKEEEQTEEKKFVITEKQKKIAFVVLGILVIIALICWIIFHFKSRKLDKLLDKM